MTFKSCAHITTVYKEETVHEVAYISVQRRTQETGFCYRFSRDSSTYFGDKNSDNNLTLSGCSFTTNNFSHFGRLSTKKGVD